MVQISSLKGFFRIVEDEEFVLFAVSNGPVAVGSQRDGWDMQHYQDAVRSGMWVLRTLLRSWFVELKTSEVHAHFKQTSCCGLKRSTAQQNDVLHSVLLLGSMERLR